MTTMPVSIYGADEFYFTPIVGVAPQYENAKVVKVGKRRLVSLYAFNNSGTDVYLAVMDSVDGVTVNRLTPYLIPAGSYISVAVQGGERHENGIYLKAFTDAALSVAAGNVMFYKVWFTAYH